MTHAIATQPVKQKLISYELHSHHELSEEHKEAVPMVDSTPMSLKFNSKWFLPETETKNENENEKFYFAFQFDRFQQ